MSKKVVTLLNKYGPMLSGELARKFEHEYGASNTAARQALSRAKKPVNKICTLATVYKGNIIKNLIMDCQSYTKYRPNETTGGIFVSWRRKEELPTGA